MPFEGRLKFFGLQVGGLGGPNCRFGSCGAQMKVWEIQWLHGRGLEGLGLAQGRLGTWIWVQHGPNLSHVGANLGPAWAQLEPTWSQLGSMLGPDRLK